MKRFFQVLNRFEEILLSLMVLQMGLSIFLQVVMRYAFHSAITWLDELVHIEVVLLAFFGAGLGIKHGAHISVDALKTNLKDPWLGLVEALGHLVMAAYCGLVVYYGLDLVSLMTERVHYTPTLRIPKHYLYFLVCCGLILIGLRSLFGAWQNAARALAPGPEGKA